MLNLNLERYGRFLVNGVEQDKIVIGNAEVERAVPTQTSKSASVSFRPTRVVKNLFDGGERGTYVSTSGAKVDSDGKYRSKNKIPVVAGQTYSNNIINKPSWVTFAQLNIFGYDAQGVFIWSGTTSINAWSIGRPFTMPENTAYITVSTFGTVVDTAERVAELNEKFIIVEGSTVPSDYYPYFAPETVLSHLKPFGNHTKHKAPKLWGQYVPAVASDTTLYPMVLENLLDPSDIQLGRGYRAGSGAPSSNTGFSSTGKQLVEPNSLYSTNFNVGTNGTFGLCFFKSDDTYISGISLSTGFATFTTPSECSYVYITTQENPPATGKYLYKGNSAVYVPFGKWKFVKNVGTDGTGTDFGYFNEATGEFVKAQGASGTLIQPITYADTDGTTTCVNTGITKKAKFVHDIAFIGTSRELMGYSGTSPRYWGSYSGNVAYELSNDRTTLAMDTSVRRKVTYDIINGKISVNGIDKTFTAFTPDANTPYYLFKTGANGSSHAKARLWGFEAYDTNDLLIQDLIPVRIGTTVELLDLVNWQFATRVGTLTAGADIPYEQIVPDIIKVNTGDLKYGQYSKNLVDFNETRIDRSTWATADKSKGFEIVSDIYGKNIGDSLGGNANCFGVFVPCKKGGSVSLDFFDYTPYYGRCFYCEVDADFKVLTTPALFADSSSITQKTFTATSDNCIGFAIEWYISSIQTRDYNKENYMVVSGTTVPTEYEPYKFGIFTTGSHKLIVRGKNLFDISKYNQTDKWIGVNYKYIEIPLPNGTYTMSWDTSTMTAGNNVYWLLQVDGSNKGTSSTGTGGSWVWHADIESLQHDVVTFTVTQGAVWLTCSFGYDATFKSKFLPALSTTQIEEGSTATSREPYIPPVTRDIPMLLSEDSFVDTQLDSNNKSEAWGIAVMNGTNVGVTSKQGNVWVATVSGKVSGKVEIVCTHFLYSTGTSSTAPDHTCISFNSYQFGFRADEFSTAVEANAWLASEYTKGTPVIFLFPLATPALSTHAIAPVELTEKTTYTATSEAEMPVTVQAEYLGI